MAKKVRRVCVPVWLVLDVPTHTKAEAQCIGQEVSDHVFTCMENGHPIVVEVMPNPVGSDVPGYYECRLDGNVDSAVMVTTEGEDW
jgi:hypothetical protein